MFALTNKTQIDALLDLLTPEQLIGIAYAHKACPFSEWEIEHLSALARLCCYVMATYGIESYAYRQVKPVHDRCEAYLCIACA